jgi:hypothetical protein
VKRAVSLAIGLLGGAAIAVAAGLAVVAQPANNQSSGSGDSSGSAGPPGVPVIQAPPEVTPPDNGTSDEGDNSDVKGNGKKAPTNSVAAAQPAAPPAAGPKPVRSPAAVLQALDKVTTETMRFAAPVGQPVRYKNLVFVVKACESTGLGGPSPQESAYVVIDVAPLASEGIAPPPPRQVFKGWLFANSPGLNPFQHPTYDAWLITCMAAAPPA